MRAFIVASAFRLLATLWAIDQYNARAGVPLSRGSINLAINAAQTLVQDVPCGGTDWLVVNSDMTGTAAGDLIVTVVPYEGDGVTLSSTTLPPVAGYGFVPTLAGGHVTAVQKYDVTGIDKVQLQVKNNNVAAQTGRSWWRTQGF